MRDVENGVRVDGDELRRGAEARDVERDRAGRRVLEVVEAGDNSVVRDSLRCRPGNLDQIVRAGAAVEVPRHDRGRVDVELVPTARVQERDGLVAAVLVAGHGAGAGDRDLAAVKHEDAGGAAFDLA